MFDLDQNTHLIIEQPQGAKFDLAMSSPEIYIVSPGWLDSCYRNWKRIPERDFCVQRKPVLDNRKPPPPTPTTTTGTPQSLLDQLDKALGDREEIKSVFECHFFLLLGFEEDLELKKRLGKLIRRGLGTIYWEMTESTTMMILHDTCHEAIRYVEIVRHTFPYLESCMTHGLIFFRMVMGDKNTKQQGGTPGNYTASQTPNGSESVLGIGIMESKSIGAAVQISAHNCPGYSLAKGRVDPIRGFDFDTEK